MFQIDLALTCNFCNSPDVDMMHMGSDSHFVHCNGCQADGPVCHTEECCVRAWNRSFPRSRRDGKTLIEPARYEGDENEPAGN